MIDTIVIPKFIKFILLYFVVEKIKDSFETFFKNLLFCLNNI